MNLAVFLNALGGLGLFLFGMTVLTAGLQTLAGSRLRAMIERFTHSATSGALSGAVLTALLQSSSATTLVAVGFVGGGLLTFPQALGLILGANAGTTATGWIVALVGFKLDIAGAMGPVLLAGVLLRFTGRARATSIGGALAGFALVFLGIDMLQGAMAGLEGRLLPEALIGGGFAARIGLVATGALVTALTQSSSAGVATTLAALATGRLGFDEAAALVIGMDVGTTATAVIATFGGTVAMRRTALSHVVFNLFSAVSALALLPLFTRAAHAWRPGVLDSEPELALVAFHTAFNVLAVLAILPFATSLARWIERLVPSDSAGPELEPRLLADPALALRAATRAGLASFDLALRALAADLGPPAAQPERGRRRPVKGGGANELDSATGALQAFVFQIAKASTSERDDPQIAALMHFGDHLDRLSARLRSRPRTEDPELATLAAELSAGLAHATADGTGTAALAARLRDAAREFEAAYDAYTKDSRSHRLRVLSLASSGALELAPAERELDGRRWLQRVTHHLWRAAHHAAEALEPAPAAPPIEPGVEEPD